MNELTLLRSTLNRCQRVLILSCGNASRGDDGIGPWLHHQLRHHVRKNGWENWISLQESFQWQPEDALTLQRDDLVFFIDADHQARLPYRLLRVKPSVSPLVHSHALSPGQLLTVAERIGQPRPLGAWQLGIPGQNFELGEALSEQTRWAGEQALAAIMELLSQRANSGG